MTSAVPAPQDDRRADAAVDTADDPESIVHAEPAKPEPRPRKPRATKPRAPRATADGTGSAPKKPRRPSAPRATAPAAPPLPALAPEVAAAVYAEAGTVQPETPHESESEPAAESAEAESAAASPIETADDVDLTVEEDVAPLDEAVAPEEEVAAPIEEVTAPVDKLAAPVEEVAAPAEEADVELEPVSQPEDTMSGGPVVVEERDEDAGAAPASDGWALRLRGVTKTYGETHAVSGIDLAIPVGSFYGLVGPNGAGKTTTLSMIAGLLRPDGGEIEIAGVDLRSHASQAKRQMGILPDRLRTFDRLSGRQLLYYYGVLRGLKPAVVETRIADLARAFELTDALGRSVADYSAGMTKKVMLAGAMIHSPRLLVLDEPFESVDPVSSAVILDILRAYVDHGGTVVLSSHGMDLVQRACSGVAVIVGGRVLASGTVDEVRAGRTLEERFLELAGGTSAAEGLEWLHTFSD